MKTIYGFLLSFLITVTAFANDATPKEGWSKEAKYYTTLGILWTGVLVHEEYTWDLDRSFHFQQERWFEKDTKSAGNDKVGHVYSAYFLVRTLTPTYEHYGYTKEEAIRKAVFSSFLLMTTMEIADGFTSFGFSWNDLAANSLGQYLGYLMEKKPRLNELFEFRSMPYSSFEVGAGKTDLHKHSRTVINLKHFVAFKFSGLDATKDTTLRYFDLHLGYDVTYQPNTDDFDRNMFVGFNINVGNVLRNVSDSKWLLAFDLIQLPYTMSESFFTPGKTELHRF